MNKDIENTHREGEKSTRKRSHPRKSRKKSHNRSSRAKYHEKGTRKERHRRSLESHEDSNKESVSELNKEDTRRSIIRTPRRSGSRRRRSNSRNRRRLSCRSRSRRRSRSRSRSRSTRRSRSIRRSRSRRRSRKHHGPSTSPEDNHVSRSNVNDNTQLLLTELIKSISNNRPEGNKFPMLGNVIPEFDPMVKGQTIDIWLSKVEDCARLYKWGDDQTIHYALPKLSGVAKTWYQTLPSMSFSWPEWKIKLIESFPSSDDYAELLTEMLSKRAKYNDSLELYFYEKINLLHRCEIKGKRAVDCLLYGIEDRSLRLGAKALKCEEPEQVLKYFQSIKQQPRESDNRMKANYDKRINTSVGNSSKQISNSKAIRSNDNTKTITCYNCKESGHYSFNCTRKILKCNICNKIGHLSTNCPKLPSSDTSKPELNQEKSILALNTITNESNDKYLIDLKINNQPMRGYVDLGSQCTLLRHSTANRLGIKWSSEQLPTMRGIGNNVVRPIGRAVIKTEIQGITETIDSYIVEDSVIKYDVLIGHSFTEIPGITITKTSDALIFGQTLSKKLRLLLLKDVSISPRDTRVIKINTDNDFSGVVYVNGSLRGCTGMEYYLMPGEYNIINGTGALLIQNISNNLLKLKQGTLMTRAPFTDTFLNINILDFNDLNANLSLNYGKQLSSSEIQQLKNTLQKYNECFSRNMMDLGYSNVEKIEIELIDTKPVVYRPYRLSYPERQLVKSMVREMLDADIICESNSSYASPVLLIKKKTGDKRLCIDYRALNRKTKKEHFPLPLIDDQLDRLSGNSLFISLDLASGYYQLPVGEDSQDKTAFVTPDGQYQFKRMPFGLTNAPSVFQRAMNKILSKIDYTLVFMDDILIPARTFDEGLRRLDEVLNIFREANLTLKLEKCFFFYKQIDFLGFEVSGSGIRPGSRKTVAVSNFPVPKNVHDVRRFIGLASFFRRFVKDFSLIARPLTDLLKKQFQWKWTDEHTSAFETLKSKLIERPLLALYDSKFETELHTDASKYGIAGILMQRSQDGLMRPVAYYSRKTTNDEQKLHSFDLETLAVIASLNRFRVYLLGLKFKIITDCNALRTTMTKRDLVPRIGRWWVQLQEYDCEIEYRAGSNMSHVDALSRAPVAETPNVDRIHVIDILTVDAQDWIATVQSDDDEVKRIKEILSSKDTKFIVDVHKNYQLKGNYVYRIVDNGLRWVVPKSVRWQLLKMNHDDVGHFGHDKTLKRLKDSFWFSKMRRFTKKYVSACLECAYHKTPGGPKEGLLHPIPKPDIPFHTVHADHLGPFVRSRRGNMYLLIIIDAFTKFIAIKPVRDTKTATAIRIFKEYFSYFGAPTRLITDRGSCFTSVKFKNFIENAGIKHILNAVATPRANGQVERFNRTVLDALSTKCHDKSDNSWDEYVNEIQLGLNTSVNKTTSKSPSELLFGYKVKCVTENLLSDAINTTIDRVSGNDLIDLRNESIRKIEDAQKVTKHNYDKHRKPARKYSEGDLVRLERTTFDKDRIGKSKKLLAKFHGPYRIVKILPNDRFLVEDTPLTRKGPKKYENIVSIDKIHPWLNFKGFESENDSDVNDSTDESDCNLRVNK